MHHTDELYAAYLEEMHALENFRMTYTGVHDSVSLEREDPEVRRLIEALAFFNARTRRTALDGIVKTRRRLFQQFYSFLLSPLPAMGLLQANITGRFAEPTTLPQDTEIAITNDDGRTAIFRTLYDMRILPIRIDGLETLLLPKAGVRFVLNFKAGFARNDDLQTISLLVNHLNDYPASLNAQHNLKKHLDRASIVFNTKVKDTTAGTPCELTFGAPSDADGHPAAPHPVQKVRLFLHYPQRDLYMNVKVKETPRNWKSFSIIFDMKPTWPKNLRLNQEMFQLFAVPVVNLRSGMADMILADGTEERFAVRHPEPARGFAIHSLLGVFDLQKKGSVAIRPGIVGGGGGSYELERENGQGPDGKETCYLKLNMPDSFTEEKKIVVEALWFQRWFSENLSGRLTVALSDRNVAGVDFELLGEVRPHVENQIGDDPDALLTILAMKSKSKLDINDMNTLLAALGTIKWSVFKTIPALIEGLEVSSAPRQREKGGGLKHTYHFRLREFDATRRPLVEVFLLQLQRLLTSWVPDGAVSVEGKLAGGDEVIKFEG